MSDRNQNETASRVDERSPPRSDPDSGTRTDDRPEPMDRDGWTGPIGEDARTGPDEPETWTGPDDSNDRDESNDGDDSNAALAARRSIEPGSPTLENAIFVLLGIVVTMLVVARGFGVV